MTTGESMCTLLLHPGMFGEVERPLIETPRIRVVAFRYSSGVEALRVSTRRTELVFLPFRGQQIWRYCVDGEDMTMKTHFAEPTASTVFGETYGAFLLHCGLTGIGHPAEVDSHALHGELPNATYHNAKISLSMDDACDALVISGSFRLRISHGVDVIFHPKLTVRSETTAIEIGVRISNLRRTPFDYSYLCHVNWCIVDGSKLFQTVDPDPQHFMVAPHPNQDGPTASYTSQIGQDPERGSLLESRRPIVPEYCVILKPWSDAEGRAHFLMARPDGKAAYVCYETAALPYAIRLGLKHRGRKCRGVLLTINGPSPWPRSSASRWDDAYRSGPWRGRHADGHRSSR